MGKKPQQSQLEIGVRIRSARLARKMSQAELAERAGISLSHVSEVETGKTDMRLSHFVKIIEALQVSADTILCAEVPETNIIKGQEYEKVLADCTPTEISMLIKITEEIKSALRNQQKNNQW